MVALTAKTLEDELRRAGLVDVASDGIAAWRALFHWPRWYDRWSATRAGVGVLTRWLDHVPLPRVVRRRFGLQLLVVGHKPRAATSHSNSSRTRQEDHGQGCR